VRRVLKDSLISAAALLVLLAALIAVDDRVRDHVVSMVRHDTWTSDLSRAKAEAAGTASVLYTVAKDQSMDHAPMVVFVVVATALVVAMLRL
jgi:hypothetical protein